MTEFPASITEADIKQMSGDKSFERGLKYYQGGALFDRVRQGSQLRSYCEGSSYEPYRVSATLATQGSQPVMTTECSCPYDWGWTVQTSYRFAISLGS